MGLLRKGYSARSPGLFKMEYQPTGRASCGFAGTRGSTEVTGGPDIADGTWHRISCTKTATFIELTVDSYTITKKARIGEISNTDPVVLGAYPGSEFFLGTLDEAVIEIRNGDADDDREGQ